MLNCPKSSRFSGRLSVRIATTLAESCASLRLKLYLQLIVRLGQSAAMSNCLFHGFGFLRFANWVLNELVVEL